MLKNPQPDRTQAGPAPTLDPTKPYVAPYNGGAGKTTDALELTQEQVTVEEISRIAGLDPTREYVAGGDQNFVNPLLVRSLTGAFDDLTRDMGFDVYEQMLRDPAVASSVETLKTLTLAEPLRATNCIDEPEDPNFAKGKEYADFITHCFTHTERPLIEVLHEMLDALWRGSYVSEVIMRDETTGPYKGKQTLKKIAPKNSRRYWMVVDRFYNLLGIVRQFSFEADFTGMTFGGRALIPRDHLAVLTFWGEGGDPRGASILRPAYNAWYLRQQSWPAYLRWITQWATPSIIGYTPENAPSQVPIMNASNQPTYDGQGTMLTESPEDAMLRALLRFQAGSAIALVGGSKLDKIQSEGTGQAFHDGLDMLRREIVLAILRVTRVTLEAQHGSKADSSDAHDILAIFCEWIKQHVIAMIDRDVVTPLLVNNFGIEALEFAPKITLQGTEKKDLAKMGATIAQLFSAGYLHSSQIPGIDAILDLPQRDMEAQMRDEQDAADQARMNSTAQLRLMNPQAGVSDTPKPPGGDLGPPGSAARVAAANDAKEGVRVKA